MRWAGAVVLLMLVPVAEASMTPGLNWEGLDVAQAFGEPALPLWQTHVPPGGLPGSNNAGEPTLGIPWDTDSVFYKARGPTYKITFDDGVPAQATWKDVTPPLYVTDVDPMLHADPVTNRVWSGGLAGPCSLMSYSDDDGATWVPTGNMCTGAQFDHQTIGSGPWSDDLRGALYPHAVHYCGQLAWTACATSHDGGLTWGPWNLVTGACGGLHGHLRVSPATGTAVVPHKSCGGKVGFAFTENDGLTWSSRVHGGANSGRGFDPSAQFTQDAGWLYLGQADSLGAHVGLSKDEGRTSERLAGTDWLDVGAFHDPPIVKAAFADMQAGDDDRAAFGFLGLVDLDGDGKGTEYGDVLQCDKDQDLMVWHYYVAMTHDAGQTWQVQRATSDPVQVGGIWLGQGGTCRNLLDFYDMDIDSTGRVHVGYSDGCTGACDDNPSPSSGGYRSTQVSLLRQATGRGLFAAHDLPGAPAPTAGPTATPTPPVQQETTRLTVSLGNGSRVDQGPLRIEGTIAGPPPDASGSGRVHVHGPSGGLGSTRVDARPDGVPWSVPVDLDGFEGRVELEVSYDVDGDVRATVARWLQVVPPGEGEPAEAVPDLQVLDGPDASGTVRLRLGVLGETGGDRPWRLLVDGTSLRSGTVADLPLEVRVDGLRGPVGLELVLEEPRRADREEVVGPPRQAESPAFGVTALVAGLVLVAVRRRWAAPGVPAAEAGQGRA